MANGIFGKMEKFERSLLIFLLELYDAHTSAGYEPPKKKQKAIEEMRTALFKPHKMHCFRSEGICCYSLSSYHMKKCPGLNNCVVAIAKKNKERAIVFE